MQHSKTQYLDNPAQLSSAGLIIRQKEPKNLEAPFDRIDSYLTPRGGVLHPQSFSDTKPRPRLLSTAHRWRSQASVLPKLRGSAKYAIRNAGRHPGVRG